MPARLVLLTLTMCWCPLLCQLDWFGLFYVLVYVCLGLVCVCELVGLSSRRLIPHAGR